MLKVSEALNWDDRGTKETYGKKGRHLKVIFTSENITFFLYFTSENIPFWNMHIISSILLFILY